MKYFLKAIICSLFFYSSTSRGDICSISFEGDTLFSDIIFQGTVIKIQDNGFMLYGRPRDLYTFKVARIFKGLEESEGLVSIVIDRYGSFELDKEYYVFAKSSGSHNKLYCTNDCSNNRLVAQNNDFRNRLGKYRIPPIETKRFIDELHSTYRRDTSDVERCKQKMVAYKKMVKTNQNENAFLKKLVGLLSIGVLLLMVYILTLLLTRRQPM